MRRHDVLGMMLWLALAAGLAMGCDLERNRIGSESDETEADAEPTWPEPEPGAEQAEPQADTVEPVAEPEPEPEPMPEPEPEPEPEPPVDWSLIDDVRDLPPDDGFPPTVGPALMNGQWIGGRANRFMILLEIDGTLISGRDLGSDVTESTLFEMVEQHGAHVTYRAAGAGEIVQVHTLFLSRDEVLAWLADEQDIGLLRRVVPVPDELLGQWQAVENFDSGESGTVVIEPSSLHFVGDDRPWQLYPLASTGPALELVAVRSGTRPQYIRLRRISANVYLSWSDSDENFILLYREGSRPDWLNVSGDESGALTPPVGHYGIIAEIAPVHDVFGDTTDASENARTNLRQIATNAITYFSTSNYDPSGYLLPPQFPASNNWTPPVVDCGAVIADPEAWLTPTWQAVNFEITDPHHYQYRFISESPVDFEVQARIDRDCDGVYHKLSIAGFAGGEIGFDEIVEDNPGE